ncbi:MAG: GFA family protein [Congregibacter sp.]|nr:GFA family protein [Congregibacter sp.]
MIQGHCFCRRIAFQLNEEPRDRSFCHCESCRRASGATYVAWGTVDANKLLVTRGALELIQSSPGVERGFCPACGTHLTYRNASRDDEIDVTLVSLQDPARFPPDRHIWVKDKLPWITIGDALDQLPGESGA